MVKNTPDSTLVRNISIESDDSYVSYNESDDTMKIWAVTSIVIGVLVDVVIRVAAWYLCLPIPLLLGIPLLLEVLVGLGVALSLSLIGFICSRFYKPSSNEALPSPIPTGKLGQSALPIVAHPTPLSEAKITPNTEDSNSTKAKALSSIENENYNPIVQTPTYQYPSLQKSRSAESDLGSASPYSDNTPCSKQLPVDSKSSTLPSLQEKSSRIRENEGKNTTNPITSRPGPIPAQKETSAIHEEKGKKTSVVDFIKTSARNAINSVKKMTKKRKHEENFDSPDSVTPDLMRSCRKNRH